MKAKNGKKRNQADKLHAKKTKVIAKKINPFGIHENKEKFDVLNRRTTHSRGQPGVSRQLAFDKRKQTLGVEYSMKNKVNVFQDHRKNGPPKVSIYNLNDDAMNDSEVLTHRGQTLAQVERFDDMEPEEDDMSDDEVRLDAKFTEAAHFGGGVEEGMRDRKTVIEELIAESKKRKVERSREHEEILDLTDRLDSDWKELLPVVSKLHREEAIEHKPDEYDRLVKEMIFSPRGEPAEKLKNEEDVARVEKERLEKLERDRLQRMRGDLDEETVNPNQHRSADDLDDGYMLEEVGDDGDDESQRVLSYPINPDDEDDQRLADYHELERNRAEINLLREQPPEEDEEAEEGDNDDEDEEESEPEESDVDSLEDLKGGESEEEAEPKMDSKVLKISDDVPAKQLPKKPEETARNKELRETLEKIPYTIDMPSSYESLMELIDSQPVKIQGIIIERIIKTNHIRLLHINRNKMLKLFAYLLQYINDMFSNANEPGTLSRQFKLLRELTPLMFDLIQMNPEEGSKCFLEVMKEKYEEFKKNQKIYPKLDTLIFFKLLNALFPTSDFRHPIVTPSFVFLHQILSQAKVRSRADVSSAVFLVTLLLDSQQLSKKLLPSAMNILSGLCYAGIKNTIVEKMKPVPPMKKNDSFLVLDKKFAADITDIQMTPSDFIEAEFDDEFKVRTMFVVVNLMRDFVKLYDDLVGMKYLVHPFMTVLARLSDEKLLPASLKGLMKETIDDFESIRLNRSLVYLQPEQKITPMIRMLEPRVETVLSDRRSMYSQATGAKAEQQKLKHMVKREFKSAKRELRRDNEFLSKIRHKRKQDLDHERQARVKRIFNEASIQQSEYNALSRTKDRKGKF